MTGLDEMARRYQESEKKRWENPILLYVDDKEVMDTEVLYQFARKEKKYHSKIFVLPSKPNLSRPTWTEVPKSQSLNDFIQKMVQTNGPKQKQTQKNKEELNYLTQVSFNGEIIFALTAHVESELWKEIAKKIESSAIQMFTQFMKEPKECPAEQDKATGSPTNRASTKPKQQDNDETIFYGDQIKVGDVILELIRKKLSKAGNDPKPQITNCKFSILVPNRISLQEQTKSRLKDVRKKVTGSKISEEDEDNIIRINTSKAAKENWKESVEKNHLNAETLNLIIHDECHWAAGKDKVTDKLLNQSGNDYHVDSEGDPLSNVFTLMVSATPYNFLVLDQIQDENFISWKKICPSETYIGLNKLFKDGKIKSEQRDGTEEILETFKLLTLNGFTEGFILLLHDFVSALRNPNEANTFTQDLINKCKKQNTIVIRLGSAFCKVRELEVAKQVLTVASKGTISICEELPTTEHEQPTPKICLIVEKGRLGDTFPKNCIAFDLRARYTNEVSNFTSFYQDAGRAFGYNERPTLILSKKAYEFVEQVWDLNEDRLSKNFFVKAKDQLADHMQRIESKIDNDENLSFEEKELMAITNDQNQEIDQATFRKPENLEMNQEEFDCILWIIRKSFKVNEEDPVFLYGLDKKSFENRIILMAEPQIGKTGTFLYVINELCKRYRINQIDQSGASLKIDPPFSLKSYTKRVYADQTLQETEAYLKTQEGKEEHKKYIKSIKKAREKRKENGVLEPSMWAAKTLVQDVERAGGEEIVIGDFGCADGAFGKALAAEVIKDNQTNKSFKLSCFDLELQDVDISDWPSNLKLDSHKEVNCGKKEEFEQNHFDYVISTLALWGADGSWKDTVISAFHTLKPGGKLLLAEHKNYFDREKFETRLTRSNIKIHNSSIIWTDDEHCDEDKFLGQFMAYSLEKTDSFAEEKLINLLSTFNKK